MEEIVKEFHTLLSLNSNITVIKNFLSVYSFKQCKNLVNTPVNENSEVIATDTDHEHFLGYTALHFAAEYNDLNLVELCLQYEADIHRVSSIGTPLHIAMLYEHQDLFHFLIKCGANVHQIIHTLCLNAYHVLLCFGDWYDDCWIAILFDYNCDINHRLISGETPLFCDRPCMLRFLLKYGADINISDSNGTLPLNYYKDSILNNSLLPAEFYMNILSHVEKLKLINYHVDGFNNELCTLILANKWVIDPGMIHFSDTNIAHIKSEFTDEIDKMKINNFSLMSLLCNEDINALAALCRNPTVQCTLEADDFKTKFPEYHGLLMIKYRIGKTRLNLLNSAKDIMVPLLYKQKLPGPCLEMILNHLSNEELELLK
ncbi:uncharacterized protein LOC116738677 [Nasonia vitripennis]|uniref:Uncharacterized protein n=1 Tax=Nasonia vitripennis TaxID=7425 RepID=A0A7M7R1Y8_NASVI|nr:uncharacterized protein LOC116738677 [Nasonia vitripennis]